MFNFAIFSNPFNWVIIFLMLLIWAFAFDLLHAWNTDRDPSTAAS